MGSSRTEAPTRTWTTKQTQSLSTSLVSLMSCWPVAHLHSDMLTMFALDHGIRNILQLLASKKSEHLLELNDVSTLVRRTMQLRVEDDEKRVKEEDARSDSEESDTDYSVEANLMLLREALNEVRQRSYGKLLRLTVTAVRGRRMGDAAAGGTR